MRPWGGLFCSTGRFLRSRRAGGERRVGSSAQCGQSCAAELSLVTVPTDRVCRHVCTDPERAERYGDVRWGRSWASFRALGVDRASCPARWGGSDVCVRAAARLSALAPRAAEKHTLRPSGRVYSDAGESREGMRAGPFRGRLKHRAERTKIRRAGVSSRRREEHCAPANRTRLIAPGASIPDPRARISAAPRGPRFGFRFAGHPISPEDLGTCQHHISRGLRRPRARRLRAEARRSQDVKGVERRGIPQDRGCG